MRLDLAFLVDGGDRSRSPDMEYRSYGLVDDLVHSLYEVLNA